MKENENWVPLQPMHPDVEEKLEAWFAAEQRHPAFCCLCGAGFGEDDMLPDSHTHNCPKGRALEAKARRERRSRCSGRNQPKSK